MKKYKLFWVLIYFLFVSISYVNAIVEGNVDPGSGSFSGGSGGCNSGACWPYPDGSSYSTRGMRVSLINSNGTQKCSKDFIFNSQTVADNIDGEKYYSSSSKGNKVSYKKSSLSLSQGKNVVSVSYYPLSNYNLFFGTDSFNGNILTSDLEGESHENLISIVSNLGCTYDYESDYIVIEPLTVVVSDAKYYYGTIYELVSMLGNKSGLRSVFRSMANTIKLESSMFDFVTDESCNNYSNTGGGNLPGCVTGWTYQGMGLYKISDVFPDEPDDSLYSLTIEKIDNSGVVSGVEFCIGGTGITSQCKTTNAAGIVTFSNLPPLTNGNTYKLTEIFKAGYDIDKAIIYWDYESGYGRGIDGKSGNDIYWNINTLSSDRTVVVVNEKTCESEFKALSNKTNLSERIRLYNTYRKDNMKLNNLLNLNYDTDAEASLACDYSSCSQSFDTGCLAISNNQTADNNFSCYDFIPYSLNGVYCFSNFKLQNLFSNSPSSGTYQFGVNNRIKSGQLIINKEMAAQLNLDIVCYSISDQGSSLSIGKNYSNFISKITIEDTASGDDVDLGYSDEGIVLTNKVEKYGGYIYSTNSILNYKFPKIYSHIGNGKIEYNMINPQNYRFLGYGLISKLNDNASNMNQFIPLKFSITFGEAILNSSSSSYNSIDLIDGGVYTDSNSCEYKLTNEIVPDDPDNPDNPRDELNLEFRVIDSTVSNSVEEYALKAFPGRNGLGRIIGSNWCLDSTLECSSNSDDGVDNINITAITEGVNSYGMDLNTRQSTPAKYVIDLTPADIQAIREYNDEVSYDSFDLECDDSYVCISNLLENMKNQIVKTPSGETFTLSNSLGGAAVD